MFGLAWAATQASSVACQGDGRGSVGPTRLPAGRESVPPTVALLDIDGSSCRLYSACLPAAARPLIRRAGPGSILLISHVAPYQIELMF